MYREHGILLDKQLATNTVAATDGRNAALGGAWAQDTPRVLYCPLFIRK